MMLHSGWLFFWLRMQPTRIKPCWKHYLVFPSLLCCYLKSIQMTTTVTTDLIKSLGWLFTCGGLSTSPQNSHFKGLKACKTAGHLSTKFIFLQRFCPPKPFQNSSEQLKMSLLIDIKQGNFVWWCGGLSDSPSLYCVNLDQKGWDIFCYLFILSVKAHFNFILVNTKYIRKCLLHQCCGSIHNSCIFIGIRQNCQPEEKFGISRKIGNTFGDTYQLNVSLQRRLWNGTDDPLAHGWNKPVPLIINYNHSQQCYASDRKPASPADIHTVTLQDS